MVRGGDEHPWVRFIMKFTIRICFIKHEEEIRSARSLFKYYFYNSFSVDIIRNVCFGSWLQYVIEIFEKSEQILVCSFQIYFLLSIFLYYNLAYIHCKINLFLLHNHTRTIIITLNMDSDTVVIKEIRAKRKSKNATY